MKIRILIAFCLLTIIGLSLSRLSPSKPEAARPLASESKAVKPVETVMPLDVQQFEQDVVKVEQSADELRESVRSIEVQTQKLSAVIEDLDQVQKDYDAKQIDEDSYFAKREEILNRLQAL